LFAYAGSYKLVHPGEATLALLTLGITQSLAVAGVMCVTAAELYLATILLTRSNLKFGLQVSTTLMLVFSLFLAYLSFIASPPSCGCMGLSTAFHSNKHNAIFALARNSLILWLLKAAYDFHFPPAEEKHALGAGYV
jgi:hypothetical protein